MNNKSVLLVVSLLFLASCATPIKHDPTSFNVDTGPKETIPNICGLLTLPAISRLP